MYNKTTEFDNALACLPVGPFVVVSKNWHAVYVFMFLYESNRIAKSIIFYLLYVDLSNKNIIVPNLFTYCLEITKYSDH